MAATVAEIKKWVEANSEAAQASQLKLVRSRSSADEGGIALSVAGKSLILVVPGGAGEAFMAYSEDFESTDSCDDFQNKIQRLNERLDGISVDSFQSSLAKIPTVMSTIAMIFKSKAAASVRLPLSVNPAANPGSGDVGSSSSASASSRQRKQMVAVMKEFKALSAAVAAAGKDDFLGGICVEIPSEEDISTWRVKMGMQMFEDSRNLYADLKKYAEARKGGDHILLEFVFSEGFPFEPPFVRVVRPRFRFHTGHVTVGGSICMELLTKSGWSPAFNLESVLVQIHHAILEGNGRLELGHFAEYSVEEAKSAFIRVAHQHGWQP